MPKYRYPEKCPMRAAAPRQFAEDGVTVIAEPKRVSCTGTFLHDGCHRFVNGTQVFIMKGDWSWGSKKECKRMARETWERANGFPGVEPDQDP